MKIFRRGIKLPDYKALSLLTPHFKKAPLPAFVTLPLKQHQGLPAIPLVRSGEAVKTGAKIAAAQGDFSAHIHASVSGTVREVTPDYIRLESDGKDEWEAEIVEQPDWKNTERDKIRQCIFNAGLVGLGGKGFPTHLKLDQTTKGACDLLILNGCESEPFLTADFILMFNKAVEILHGARFLMCVSGAKKCLIAIEDNKLECIEIILSKIRLLGFKDIEVKQVPARYPQGSDSELKRTCIPSKNRDDVKVLIHNVATAYAVYEAVKYHKPLIERVVTITGHCIVEPQNLMFRIGTSAYDAIKTCKGFLRDPVRVIFGGPMTGVSLSHLNTPLTKPVNGIVALAQEFIDEGKEKPCIRCGLCVETCPEHLVPETLIKGIRLKDRAVVRAFQLQNCIECGNCAFVCPSNIPLLDILKEGKQTYFGAPYESMHSEKDLIYAVVP
ncbi:MAG: electron transport complex subunit RsxC [Candidatus Omnitrophica bacterium CG11_big_fil_rev_8_21_14_0_20_45_26]|uniref:Ion-translocating oxidoreductase complex subunit C n=1 Tax=Candidatus Abzuiibacterium crystallinum TaxID=1974748 RepID=A0A2H0LM81_9BACT|nr:MAG: electron transport complex subunit RsxC [Candidatus Omnitrophica bacterium CG11_big_fil_rev_8_21_14_0_20_45_26]PIW63722.1 MAG: electron transport complex subunit RsxC [Candidatus Omnitrophica bacterium CG12_big_fil_rev_8_21_14_0_65_45_16]